MSISSAWGRAASFIGCFLLSVASAFAQVPLAGPNVNMVSEPPFLVPEQGGTCANPPCAVVKWQWPYNDVFLTKQNEPSLAVSSLNPDHLLAGANDYRFVDPKFVAGAEEGGDAWIQLYGSLNGGRTWFSFPLADCTYNIPACAEPDPANNPAYSSIKILQAGGDPTIRPGPYGTFFVSFIAFNRDSSASGVTAIRRYVDRNNKLRTSVDPSITDQTNPLANPFVPEKLNIIDTGTAGQFKDKPWNIAGLPGTGGTQGLTCTIGGRTVAAFPVYVVYSNFTGQGQNQHPAVYVAVSTNCGDSFAKAVKVSNSLQASQGGSIALDPTDGTPYVAWRVFGDPTSGQADAIYFSKQTNASKNLWSNPQLVANIKPFDQPSSGGSIRTEGFPTIAISVDSSGKSRVHIAWAERKGTVDTNFVCTVPDPNLKCDARIKLATSNNGGSTWTFIGVDDAFSDPITGAPYGRGHQIQPALSFAGGKLMIVWLDQRLDQTVGVIDCSGLPSPHHIASCPTTREAVANRAAGQTDIVFTPLIIDDPSTGLTRRHTLDVYAAMADPGNSPVFTSNRVSQYAYGTPRLQSTAQKQGYPIMERQWNVVGYPIFANDTRAFLGDYVDIAAQTIFASGGTYKWNTGWNAPGCGNPAAGVPCRAAFHAAWTDNRDVVVGGGSHTPSNLLVVNADGSATTTTNAACVPGQNGSRNQNIYTSVISDTAVPYSSNNSKQLFISSSGDPRGIVVGVENLSMSTRTFTLQIRPNASYSYASFDSTNPAVTAVQLTVAPRATATRSVWLKSSVSPAPTVTIDFYDYSGPLPPTVTPLQQIVLNPDPTAIEVTNTGYLSASDLANNDLTNASVKTLDMTNSDMTNLDLANLDMTNLDMANLDMANLDMANLDMANSDLTNSDMTNLDLANSDLTNLDMANLDMANFNAAASDMTNSDMANLDFMNLDFTNSDLTNLDFTNSDLTNTSFADYSVTVSNKGNTDTTLGVKLLTRGDATANPKLQLVLRKTTIKPTVQQNTCRIGGSQQTTQTANQPGACTTLDPAGCANNDTASTIGTFDAANKQLLTLPLAAGEKAQLAVRVLVTGNQDATNDFANWGAKLVVTDASNKTKTRIPLIIKSLSLTQHANALSTTNISITAWGGFLNSPSDLMTWSLPTVSGVPAAPAWLSVSAAGPSTTTNNLLISTGNLVAGPTAVPGTYQFAVRVLDESTPQQTDTQRFTLVVDKALTTTTLSSSPNPSTYGQSMTLTATVSPDPSAVNPPARTGTVTFKDGANTLGTVDVSTPTLQVSTLNAGTHSLTAVYSGDATYAASTSAALAQVVNPAPQTVTIAGANPLSKIYTDPAFTPVATGSASGNPITFAVTAGTACSVNATSGVVTILAAGSCTVTATQASSANYLAGSASVVINVSPAALTIKADDKVMTFGDPLPAFTVSYSPSQPAAGQLSGTLTFTLTPSSVTGIGPYTITPGGLTSTNYAISFSSGTLTVGKATTAFSNLSSPSILPNTPTNVLISGTLKYGTAIPSGDTVVVTLNNGAPQNAVVDASGNFSTTFNSVSLSVGSYPIAFSYAGNANFNAASGSSTLRVEGFVIVSATMNQKRSYHTANRLNDGRVLIAGGFDETGSPTATSEVYCAVAVSNCAAADVGTFKLVGNLPSKSAGHATVLLDDGRALSTGGGNSSAELYSPVTNAWNPASGMSSNRSYHTMTVIPGSGKVLIVGGASNSGNTLNTTIVYDVPTNTFSPGPTMNAPNGRERHTATLLPDGVRILVAGGRAKQGNGYNALNSTEIYVYDPVAKTFSVSAGPAMASARYSHDAASVNGQVVVAGGNNGTVDISTAEIYTPVAGQPGSWSAASSGLSAARRDVRLSGITGNRLLADGGQNGTTPSAKADVFSGSGFSAAASLLTARTNHTSTTLLPSNTGAVGVLIAGGVGTAGTLNSAEIYFSAP